MNEIYLAIRKDSLILITVLFLSALILSFIAYRFYLEQRIWRIAFDNLCHNFCVCQGTKKYRVANYSCECIFPMGGYGW